jgi:hypothetical protein
MALDDRGELVGADVVEAEVGDGVDGLGMPAAAGGGGGCVRAALAGDLSGEPGVRECDPGLDGGELEGA